MDELTTEEYEVEITKYVKLLNWHYNKRLDAEETIKKIKIIADNFLYEWLTNNEISKWYTALQKIISEFKENPE